MFGSKDKNLTPLGGDDITKTFIFLREYTQTLTPSWESALYLRVNPNK